MKNRTLIAGLFVLLSIAFMNVPATAQWQVNQGRNIHKEVKDLPDHLGADNLIWHLDLNRGPFFNMITVDGDKVYCGLSARNLPEPKKGGGTLICVDLKTGKILWDFVANDRAAYGLSAVPLIEDDAIFIFSNEELIRIDKDANVVWRNSAHKQEYWDGQHGAHGTGVIIGDYWYQPTGFATGSDDANWPHNSVERPWHPNIVVVNKHTGELVAQDDIVIGPHQHGAWSSLSTGKVGDKQLVFWGSPHGYIYAFEAPESSEEGKVSTLKEVWRCDANPKEYRVNEEGVRMPYPHMGPFGPSEVGWCEIIGAPVFHEGKLYVTLARDKAYSRNEKGRRIGPGGAVCIDPSGTGDVTETHKLWTNKNINRTFSPPSIVGSKMAISTHAGYVNCLDLSTGEEIWTADIQRCIWNYFQNCGDGKIYVMNEGRDFHIIDFETGKILYHTEVDAVNNPMAGMTDGILIVGTQASIAAYGGPEFMKTHEPAPLPEKPQFQKDPDDKAEIGGH